MSVMDYIDTEVFSPVFQNRIPQVHSDNIDRICKELFYAVKGKEEIFVYGDYDMDGFCCSLLWRDTLASLYDVPPTVFMYGERQHTVDRDIIRQVQASGARLVLICDSGSGASDKEIVSQLRMLGKVPVIIDHHNWSGNYRSDSRATLVFNSYEEKNSLGGCEISGAYASLLIARQLCEDHFGRNVPYSAMVYALASMYSDVVDLSSTVGRALYNATSIIKMPLPPLFSAMNAFDYSVSRSIFSFIIAHNVNACLLKEYFVPFNQAFTMKDKYGINTLAQRFAEVHSYATKLTELFVPQFTREAFGDLRLCIHHIDEETRALHIRNFSGLIANNIAKEEKSVAVVVIKDGLKYEGSFRDFYNRKMLNVFKLFCSADGHDAAFGLSFTNSTEIRRHLIQLSQTMERGGANDYQVLSSSLVGNAEDIQVLAMYNEYMNVKPRLMLTHRCGSARVVKSTRYRKFYDVGLPYLVCSTVPIYEGSNILIEPTISQNVELRCVD